MPIFCHMEVKKVKTRKKTDEQKMTKKYHNLALEGNGEMGKVKDRLLES